jgi:acyl carrier protein
MLEIFREHLQLDDIGVDDNFFALGGHSLLATKLINDVNGQYNLEVSVRAVFEFPTARALAGALSERADEWLAPSSVKSSILERAPRRVLHQLDELLEEDLDRLLDELLDDLLVDDFDGVDALVRWARQYDVSADDPPVAGGDDEAGPMATLADVGPATPWFFWQHLYDLSRINTALAMAPLHTAGGHEPGNGTPPGTSGDELLAELDHVFGAFAKGVTDHLGARSNGSGPIPKAELTSLCAHVIWIAGVASSARHAARRAARAGRDST